jgi:hypothetical protein
MNLLTDAAARALDPTADLTTNAADILFYATGNPSFFPSPARTSSAVSSC